MTDQPELFAAVDALLAHADDLGTLPAPAERKRLRYAAGLSPEQVAKALRVRPTTLRAWEDGTGHPTAEKLEAYRRLLEGLAGRFPPGLPTDLQPAAPTAPAPAPTAEAEPGAVTAPAHQAPTRAAAPPPSSAAPPPSSAAPPSPAARPTAGTRPASTSPRPAAKADEEPDPRFANGPLLVLDGDGTAYGVGGLVLDCPARTLPALVDWTLTQARIGAPRLHRSGKDSDPLIVLTPAAATRLGLPERLEDRRGLRLPDDHPAVQQLTKAKWKLTRRGFGPWARIYRPAEDGRRQCVQLAVLPWDALDRRTWQAAAHLPPAELAHVLGEYATRVLTPRGSAAVNGLELMTSLRPPTRAVPGEAGGRYISAPTPGSLTSPVDPAPPEAPDEHPVAQGRTAEDVLEEEAYEWTRDPELLTDAECLTPYAVGLDINMAFAAAANRLNVGLGAPVHVTAPAFDKTLPGCWHVDLSHITFDPRLPNPFTPHGAQPTGPAWYATPTVAYAVELGHHVQPTEAWIRPEHGPYLDPWYTTLRDAYLATMAELGVTTGMQPADFLTAMAHHQQADPAAAAVLSAIKATVKGGIGKLRERPQGARHKPGERWPALQRPTWRPDIRAAVISTARVNMHRKMLRWATAADLYPLAVLSDCVVYPSTGPSPLDLMPADPATGKPLTGGFRLGVSPGMVKHEGTQSFLWAAQMLDTGHNPARHIKGTDAADDAE